jgi:very-short-patch-repair endonuclease
VSATASARDDVLRDVERLAARQGGVMSRRQLLACGVPRWRTRSQVRAKRWRVHGRQTVAVHTGDLGQPALLWAGTFEAGTRGVLDGTAALLAAGLQGYAVDRIRVSVPRGAKVHRSLLFDIRQTRRLVPSDVDERPGPPRVRPEVAAVRAALWAATDRQAALIVSMVVQQRIAAADAIGRELLAVQRDRRRRFVERVVLDVMGGSESLGELDLMRECRRRGIPLPDRQVVRRGARGTFFLDARWARFGVVLEIDGIHHVHATQVVGDALRQNDVVLDGDLVLRLPLLGLRVSPDAFFAQLTQALRTRGWQGRHSA